MNLFELLGVKSESQKIDLYKSLKRELAESYAFGEELAERYQTQKSIIDEISHNGASDEARSRAMEKYDNFLKEHQKEVAKAVSNHNRIMKSIERLRKDERVGQACRDIDFLDSMEQKYRAGEIKKSLFFDILKAKTGQPTKYADVIVQDPEGRILILWRCEDYIPTGYCCIPGGHVDPGEDFKTAALRELMEETNIVPTKDDVFLDYGEYKTKDAHIHYFCLQCKSRPVVAAQALEHCAFEWVEYGKLPVKPFIYDQGKIVLEKLNKIHDISDRIIFDEDEEVKKALLNGELDPDDVCQIRTRAFRKALGIEEEKPLMPESMEGVKYVQLPVRDVKRCIESFMKGVGKCQKLVVNDKEVCLEEPVLVKSVEYSKEPEQGRLCDVKIGFIGSESDMRILMEALREGFLVKNVVARTPEEEFLSVNLNGTDYVGEPVFL